MRAMRTMPLCCTVAVCSLFYFSPSQPEARGWQGGPTFICGFTASQANNISQLGAVSPVGFPAIPGLDADIHNDCEELRKILHVQTRTVVLDESTGPNAFAMPGGPNDGVVYLGRNLVGSEMLAGRGLAIPGILGHEYCHILQARLQYPWQGKLRELHSDFFAGWFVAHRGRFNLQDPFAPWASVTNRGDYEFASPIHHGTPQERAAAFAAGYNFNRLANVSDPIRAYWEGVEYIKRIP